LLERIISRIGIHARWFPKETANGPTSTRLVFVRRHISLRNPKSIIGHCFYLPRGISSIFHAYTEYRGETIAVTIHSISIAGLPKPRIPATRYEMSNYIIILFFL
jgi:hypothetical protein